MVRPRWRSAVDPVREPHGPGLRGWPKQVEDDETRHLEGRIAGAEGEHLAVLHHVLGRLDPGPDPDRLDLRPGPQVPRRAIEGRPDPPRERGPGPAPARLGRRGGLRRRPQRALHLLQSRGAPAPGLRVGRPGPRPEHAPAHPPYPPRRLTPTRSGPAPIFRTFHNGEGTLGEEDVLWRADGSPIPVEYRAHPIRPRRRDPGRRGDLRRRRPEAAG